MWAQERVIKPGQRTIKCDFALNDAVNNVKHLTVVGYQRFNALTN